MKKTFLLMTVIFFLLLLSGCNKTNAIRRTAKLINENSNFELDLLEPIDESTKKMYNVEPGFGIYSLYSKSIDIETNQSIFYYIDEFPLTYYDVTAFPDHSDPGDFVTKIATSESKVKLFDVGVANTIDEITTAFETNGFKLKSTDIPPSNKSKFYRFSDGNIGINVVESTKTNDVYKIMIIVPVTNKHKIVF